LQFIYICNSLCCFKALFFQNNKYQPSVLPIYTESNVVHDSPPLSPFLSSFSSGFIQDNRIPCVAPANRTEICAIHMDGHVTFCHRGKKKKSKKGDKTWSSSQVAGYLLTHAVLEEAFSFRCICIHLCELTRQRVLGISRHILS